VPTEKLQQEGLFDIMKGVIAKIGPTVIKQAPNVIRAMTPIVAGILQQGTAAGGAATKSPTVPVVGSTTGNTESSFLEMIENPNSKDKDSTRHPPSVKVTIINKDNPGPAKYAGQAMGNKTVSKNRGFVVFPSDISEWQANDKVKKADDVLFVDCRQKSDSNSDQQIAGNVFHLPLPTTLIVSDYPKLVTPDFKKELSKFNQVIFYCKQGSTRSVQMTVVYLQSLQDIAPDKLPYICLLAGGFDNVQAFNEKEPNKVQIDPWT